jgi:hypothetical protein
MAQGLTAAQLAERISERLGKTVSAKVIHNAEAGHTGVSNELLDAWATELKLNPRDVRGDAEIRSLVAEMDAKAEDQDAAA